MKKQGNSLRKILFVVLAILVLIPYLGLIGVKLWYENKVDKISNARFIIVDKESMSLKLYDYTGSEIKSYGISCGKKLGDKKVIGDLKTPEGVFHFIEIEEAST